MTTTTTPLVFITGASSGIGQALAARYAQAGWRLALVARRTAEVQAWAQAQGLPAAARGHLPRRRGRCGQHRGRRPGLHVQAQGLPDVVIANAGISVGMDTAERADLDVLRDTLATNNIGLAATFHPFVR
jgi:NADP-dependent 3-hydroxy acid dehydrogenase YdfG